MDEATNQELQKLLPAVKSLYLSLEHAAMSGQYGAAVNKMVKNYHQLHGRLLEILPDDYYVMQSLELELDDDASSEEIVAQVRFAANQMNTYLRELVRQEQRGSDDPESWGHLARDLQDQIINLTRNTVKRAIANIDLNFGDDDDDMERRPKRKVRVNLEEEGVEYADVDEIDDLESGHDDKPKRRIRVSLDVEPSTPQDDEVDEDDDLHR